jgi:septal ring factor EnvC (AmiA/AmiB activator)
MVKSLRATPKALRSPPPPKPRHPSKSPPRSSPLQSSKMVQLPSKPSKNKTLLDENTALKKEVSKLEKKIESLKVDIDMYRLKIRATEDENARVRKECGKVKCRR